MIERMMKLVRTATAAAMFAFFGAGTAAAQKEVVVASPRANWYLQLGVDMTLQNPYNSPEGSALREGRTGGVDFAAGRWFTPQIGLRGRVNWENGFAPFSNKNATWLNFLHPGELNAEHGGYLSVVGDVQIDLHGLLFPYRESRVWRCQVFPRAGLVYNIGLQKGSPLIGAGLGNTFRIDRRFTIFFDMTYQMVSSGFNGRGTDIGTGSNGYFDATLGVQLNLGRSGFHLPYPNK